MFSITEAAFAGLGVARRKPALLLGWGVLTPIVGLLLSAGMIASIGPKLMQLRALSSQAPPQEALALFGVIGPMVLWMLAVELVIAGVVLAAVNRAVQTPDDDRWFYLRLGGDELRQVGTLFVLCLIMLAVEFALLIPIMVVAVIVLVLGAIAGHADQLAGGIGVGVMIACVYGLILAGMSFIAVRLSMASPLTFDRKRIQIFQSWRMTKGRFWRMFASYLLAFVVVCVLEIVMFAILGVIGVGTIGAAGLMQQMTTPDMSSLAAYWTPYSIAQLVIGAAFGPILTLTMLAPPAAIYQSIKGEGVQPDAST